MFWKSGLSRAIPPRRSKEHNEEVFTRKVHRHFAVAIAVLAVFCGTKQYFGTPINCWAPSYLTNSMINYIESSCYFAESYYVVINDFLPLPEEFTSPQMTNYYKWTPFVLAIFAVLYLIPEIILNFGGKIFWLNFDSVIEIAQRSNKGSCESRRRAIDDLVVDLQSRLSDKVTRPKRTNFRRWIDKLIPSLPFYIQVQYLSSKIVLALGAIFPLMILRYILYPKFDFQGKIMTRDSVFKNENLFPSHFLCDVTIRMLSNVQQYTIQCDLPANDLFEKTSLLLCFIAIVVCTISISDVISFMVSRLFSTWDYPYIKKHMKLITDVKKGYNRELLRDFVETYLKSDVIYLLQLIGQNSSEHVVCQILARLWEGYAGKLFGGIATKPPNTRQEKMMERTKCLADDIHV